MMSLVLNKPSRWMVVIDALERYGQNLRLILRDHPTDTVDLLCALILVAVGGTFVLPYNTFAANAAFRNLAIIASETVWGYALLSVAVFSIVATASMQWHLRFAGAILRTFLFVFLSGLFYWTDYRLPGGSLYGVLALAAYWSATRLSRC